MRQSIITIANNGIRHPNRHTGGYAFWLVLSTEAHTPLLSRIANSKANIVVMKLRLNHQ